MAQKEQRDLAKHRIKTTKIRSLIDQASLAEKRQNEELVERMLRGIRAKRRFDRVIVHVDMDMYFAACEELNDPSLKSVSFFTVFQAEIHKLDPIRRRLKHDAVDFKL